MRCHTASKVGLIKVTGIKTILGHRGGITAYSLELYRVQMMLEEH